MRYTITALTLCCTFSSGPVLGGDAETPSRFPTRAEMLAVTAPAYEPLSSGKSECLGRLVFELPFRYEWPTSKAFYLEGPFNHSFSENVFDAGDVIEIGDTHVGVVYPLTLEKRKQMLKLLPQNEAKRLRADLKKAQDYLRELKQRNNQSIQGTVRIDRAESHIEGLQAQIADENFEMIDIALADSVAYATTLERGDNKYSVLRAYLFHDQHAFAFEKLSIYGDGAARKRQREEFQRLLASFKLRKPGEVPTELGVCIPYGFIPDDGKTILKIKQSLRALDAPNVTYTISTGTVRARTQKPTLIWAIARVAAGIPGFSDAAGISQHVTQRIGPKSVTMGGVEGNQGGIVLNVKRPGKAPFEAYTLFTGYPGWLGTMAMPYMLVDMRTFTREQAPELKQDPAPFKQSKERLDYLLKGIRLRQTSPVMPELR